MERDLEQAKKRTEKVYITDIAIQKVPYIKYKNLTESYHEAARKGCIGFGKGI